MSFERFAIPNDDIGSHGAALGTDGNIYLMAYGTGRAYRFDTGVFATPELDRFLRTYNVKDQELWRAATGGHLPNTQP